MTSSFNVTVGWPDLLLRLGAAIVCGGLIGLERERHGRAAGLRTTMLVCVAATLAMILSDQLFVESGGATGSWHPDPARLAAGLLTGMGFLGGGAIIREDNAVRGVTTAAALWFVTILGLAFGSGHVALGVIGWAIAVVTLLLLAPLEAGIRHDWYGSVVATAQFGGISATEIIAHIQAHGAQVKDIDIEVDVPLKQRTVRCTLKYNRSDLFEISHRTVEDLMSCPGMLQVKWA